MTDGPSDPSTDEVNRLQEYVASENWPADVSESEALLSSGNATARERRADELSADFEAGEASDAEFEELCELLEDADAEERRAVLLAIRDAGVEDADLADQAVDVLLANCFDQPRSVRTRAAVCLRTVGRYQPPSVIRPAIDTLQDRLGDDDESVRAAAALALGVISSQHAHLMGPLVDDLRTCLDDDSARIPALQALETIAEDHPERIEPPFDDFRRWAVDAAEPAGYSAMERKKVRSSAVRTLGYVVDTYPDAARPAVDDVFALMQTDGVLVGRELRGDEQRSIVETLEKMGAMYPSSAPRIVAVLRRAITGDHGGTQGSFAAPAATEALARIAAAHPEAVVPAVAELEAGLDVSDGHRQPKAERRFIAAAQGLASVGLVAPDEVCPIVETEQDRLEAFLEAEDARMRLAAGKLLVTMDAVDPHLEPKAEEICRLLVDEVTESPTADALDILEAAETSLARKVGAAVRSRLDPFAGDESQTDDALGRFEAAEPAVQSLVVAELRCRLDDPESDAERPAVVSALGSLGSENTDIGVVLYDDLRPYVDDDDPAVRAWALVAYLRAITAYGRVAANDVSVFEDCLVDDAASVQSAAAAVLLTINAWHPTIIDHDPETLWKYVESGSDD